MGRYSGKCDFQDAIEINGLENNPGVEVFIDGRKLNVEEYPLYYTHIVSSMGISKEEDGSSRGRVNLCSEDYNTYRNYEVIKTRFEIMCASVRKLRRAKKELSLESVKNKSCVCVSDDIDDVLAAEAILCKGNEKKVDVRALIKEKGLCLLSVKYNMEAYAKYLESIGLTKLM